MASSTKTIASDDLKRHLDQKNITLIDVREPAENRAKSIDGAHLIPLAEISMEKIPSLSDTIVVYCHSGKRSAEACKKLLNQNSDLNIFSLEGGILAWEASGFSVKKSCSNNVLPLDRQTQITIGFLIVLGVTLGIFVDSIFYIIPGFIGLGLIFAGITGYCGMAKLLAKMPWNK